MAGRRGFSLTKRQKRIRRKTSELHKKYFPLLEHESPLMRRKAVWHLEKEFGRHPIFIDKMIKMCREDKNPMVRIDALGVLTKHGIENSLTEDLLKWVVRYDKDDGVKNFAGHILKQFGGVKK